MIGGISFIIITINRATYEQGYMEQVDVLNKVITTTQKCADTYLTVGGAGTFKLRVLAEKLLRPRVDVFNFVMLRVVGDMESSSQFWNIWQEQR